jgi:hypothetical protein
MPIVRPLMGSVATRGAATATGARTFICSQCRETLLATTVGRWFAPNRPQVVEKSVRQLSRFCLRCDRDTVFSVVDPKSDGCRAMGEIATHPSYCPEGSSHFVCQRCHRLGPKSGPYLTIGLDRERAFPRAVRYCPHCQQITTFQQISDQFAGRLLSRLN